jgi:outer membrane protein OmpA-like peptidoglycan-associated protein
MIARRVSIAFACIVLATSACSGNRSSDVASTAPTESASQTPSPTLSAIPTSTSSGTPSAIASGTPNTIVSIIPSAVIAIDSAAPSATPSPAATENPNLLSYARGTFVRRWSLGASKSGAQWLATGSAYAIDPGFSGTPELVFELPAVARITQIVATASLPAGSSARLHIAAATTDNAFTDIGTIALSAASGTSASGALQGPISARWLRVRVDRTPGTTVWIQSLTAAGDLAPPSLSFSGRWALADSPNDADAVFSGSKGAVPRGGASSGAYQIAASEQGRAVIAATCSLAWDVWRGPVENGSAQLEGGGFLTVAGAGSLLVGVATSGTPILARRIVSAPTCDVRPAGRGSKIAIFIRFPDRIAKLGDPAIVPGYRYETHLLPLLASEDLRGVQAAVLAMSCASSKDTAPSQRQALLDFVASGNVLIVRDADECSQSEYAFIPFPFTTSATGAGGARGSVLSIADSSVLASSDASDRNHYVDTSAYLKNPMQQIGDADIMQTEDRHWCGLMFAKNAKGTSGWVRAYARLGKGVIVYDGFDIDDLGAKIPQAILLSRLAYGLSPSAELPCNAHVASQLILLSSQHRAVPFGTARDLRFSFTIDQEGTTASQQIAMTLDGERAPGWRASLDRHTFALGASEQHLIVAIHAPANATATRHLYTVTATGENGQRAQASIELDVNEALARELEKGGRARIYGIHFDVASARIQPQSESVVREIAQVLRSHPMWHMRVEGYTDSDGGAAYNLGLSRRRAQSVVNDLIARYRIARARLKAVGYGLTHPVAPNATDAGKALNRRVELVRS